MSFFSYNLQYYENAIHEFESTAATPNKIYRAKQLLKFAEDIADEGYPALSIELESKIRGLTRLKSYIMTSGEKPFPMSAPLTSDSKLS